jgi:ATP-dependent DNA helicase RecQ
VDQRFAAGHVIDVLRGVSGVGEKKLASYGDEIVALIADML